MRRMAEPVFPLAVEAQLLRLIYNYSVIGVYQHLTMGLSLLMNWMHPG